MSSQASSGHAQPLTFGIEFEFVLARLQGGTDPRPQDGRWAAPFGGYWEKEEAQDFVQSLLAENRIPALSQHRYETSGIDYVLEEMDHQGVKPPPNTVAKHAFWMAMDDTGIERIEGEDVDGFEYVDMEVVSPILPETKFGEVDRVYSLIQSNIRTQVNSSCGLHIHIGIGHLPTDCIKKLVTLLMVVEEKGLFRTICAPHRSVPYNQWCQPVSRRSRAVMLHEDNPLRDAPNDGLDHHLPKPHSLSHNLHRALTRIWNCTDFKEMFRETLTHGHDSAFNRRGSFALRGHSSSGPDINKLNVPVDLTVELRYKESTGSAEEDHHWLQLCLHLVRCAEWSQGRFRAAVGVLSTATTLRGILSGLGVGENEVQWWVRVAQHHKDHPNPLKKTQFLEPKNFSSSDAA